MLRDTFVFFGDSRHRLSLSDLPPAQPSYSAVRSSLSLSSLPLPTSSAPGHVPPGPHSNSPGPDSRRPQQLARPRLFSASAAVASNPGPHHHRICDRREEPLPDGRRSGGDEGLGSRLQQQSPGHVSYLRPQQHSPGHVSLRPQQDPLDHVFYFSHSSRFAVSPRWCPACNAHPSRDAARRLSRYCTVLLSLSLNLCVFFLCCSLLSFPIVSFFFHTNPLEGEYCSVPPSHTTHLYAKLTLARLHKNALRFLPLELCPFLFYLYRTQYNCHTTHSYSRTHVLTL